MFIQDTYIMYACLSVLSALEIKCIYECNMGDDSR